MSSSTKILLLILSIIVVATAWIIYAAPSVFLQLFISFAIAYILNPAVSRLEKYGLSRLVSIVIVFSIASLATFLFASLIITSIGNEFSSVQINLPEYTNRIYNLIPDALKSYLGIATPQSLASTLDSITDQAKNAAPALIKPFLLMLKKAFSSSIGFILSILGYAIIPVYLFYLLADLPQLKQFIASFIPDRYQNKYQQTLEEIDSVLSGFIRGQLLVCAILAVLYSIGLYMIGIDLAIAIGMLAGITFIIPYVGTIIGIILSVAMALLKFHDLLHPLLCLGWFTLVQLLEGMIITPKIVGNTVGLHTLVALIALFLGGQLLGIMGMLLAIPIAAVLQVFLRSIAAYYRSTSFFQGEQQ